MTESTLGKIPADFLSDLEKRYFWWEPVGTQSRSEARVLAQAMELASFADIRRLETIAGPQRLLEIMRTAEPGWLSERSWELWRGRLFRATGETLPEEPPRRTFDATAL
jgi:hypothetical protein